MKKVIDRFPWIRDAWNYIAQQSPLYQQTQQRLQHSLITRGDLEKTVVEQATKSTELAEELQYQKIIYEAQLAAAAEREQRDKQRIESIVIAAKSVHQSALDVMKAANEKVRTIMDHPPRIEIPPHWDEKKLARDLSEERVKNQSLIYENIQLKKYGLTTALTLLSKGHGNSKLPLALYVAGDHGYELAFQSKKFEQKYGTMKDLPLEMVKTNVMMQQSLKENRRMYIALEGQDVNLHIEPYELRKGETIAFAVYIKPVNIPKDHKHRAAYIERGIKSLTDDVRKAWNGIKNAATTPKPTL
ncbi:hypothetical protein KW805_01590 [Candidatus Pacearchaeota archaeon]|nr:hypothetical protein [Candidatus Pacearchaeota archaeon]